MRKRVAAQARRRHARVSAHPATPAAFCWSAALPLSVIRIVGVMALFADAAQHGFDA